MNSIQFIIKNLILFLFFIILGAYLQSSHGNGKESVSENFVNQSNINQSKIDYMNTLKFSTLIRQKDSAIVFLNTKLAAEIVLSKVLKKNALKQHLLNDTLATVYEQEPSLITCDELIVGLGTEISNKDTLIDCLVAETESYDRKVSALESKLLLQKEFIVSKENLILYKDSTITFYEKQKKENAFWSTVKLNAAIGVILFETVALLLK
jgi:hypothetical protein